MSMIRRNSGPLQGNAWASSPRTKLVLFFVAFAVTYGAIKAWQIIIESDNVYLETGAAFITVIILFGIYWYYMRQYTAYRRRLNELRQAHPHPSPEEETDLNMVQLRLYLQRVYGSSFNIEALLANSGGLTVEVIDSLVRHFAFSAGKGGEGGCKVEDIELGLVGRGIMRSLGRTDSNMTTTPPVSRYCSIDKVDYDEGGEECCSKRDHEDFTLAPSGAQNHTRPSTSSPYVPVLPFGPPVECSVCLSEYCEGDALSELPCGHVYHRHCVTEWLLRHNACPMCKQAVLQLPPLLLSSTEPQPQPTGDVELGMRSENVMLGGDSAVPVVDASQVPPSLPSAQLPEPATPVPTSVEAAPASHEPALPALVVEDVEEEEGEGGAGLGAEAASVVRTPSFSNV